MATMTEEQKQIDQVIQEKLAANRALLNEYHSSTDEVRKSALTLEIDARSNEIRTLQAHFRSLRVSNHRRYRSSILGYNLN